MKKKSILSSIICQKVSLKVLASVLFDRSVPGILDFMNKMFKNYTEALQQEKPIQPIPAPTTMKTPKTQIPVHPFFNQGTTLIADL